MTADTTPSLVERLNGPPEWGYRDPVEGGWIEDLSPFEAASYITELEEAAIASVALLNRAERRAEAAEANARRLEEALRPFAEAWAWGSERVRYGSLAEIATMARHCVTPADLQNASRCLAALEQTKGESA